MISQLTLGLLDRKSKIRCHAAGLQSRKSSVPSSIDPRKGRATLQGRPSRWSVSDAPAYKASADRALWRKGHVQGYTISLPGQTGMRSPSALSFPELAAGRGANR
jgi:hypothetical protein